MAQGSIVYQIQKTVTQNVVDNMSKKHIQANKIPTTRHEAKKRGVEKKYIYSHNYGKKIMQVINRVCKFSEVKNVKELKRKHIQIYLKEKIYGEKKYKKKTIENEIAAIKKFDHCLLNTGRRSKFDESIIPTNIDIPDEEIDTETIRGGRYKIEEAKKIKEYIKKNHSQEINDIVDLQRAFGLRISEVTNLEARNINIKNNSIKIFGDQNITKSGKPREAKNIKSIQITKKEMKRIVGSKQGKEKLFKTKNRTVQKAIKNGVKERGIRDLERGTHGFRGIYAYFKLKEELKKRGISNTEERIYRIWKKHGNGINQAEKEALLETSRNMGHERISVIINDYIADIDWLEK